jgi:hypothetical protein
MALTQAQMVATLIGDSITNPTFFTMDQYAFFLTMAGMGLTPISNPYSSNTNPNDGGGVYTELFFAAAQAEYALAAQAAASLTETRIGDYMDSSGRNKVAALKAAGDAFMKIYYETPAWAIIEEDLSDMNALITIRNYVLRTNP